MKSTFRKSLFALALIATMYSGTNASAANTTTQNVAGARHEAQFFDCRFLPDVFSLRAQ